MLTNNENRDIKIDDFASQLTVLDRGHDSIVSIYQNGEKKILKSYEILQNRIGHDETKKILEKYLKITDEVRKSIAKLDDGRCLVGVDDLRYRIKTIILLQGEIRETRDSLIYTVGQKFVGGLTLSDINLNTIVAKNEELLRSSKRSFEFKLAEIERKINSMLAERAIFDLHPVNVKCSIDVQKKLLIQTVTDLATSLTEEIF